MSTNSTDPIAVSFGPEITILTTSFPRFEGDNAGRFVYDFARELSRSGCSIHVIAPHDSKVVMNSFSFAVEHFTYFFPKSFQSLAYGAGMVSRIKSHWFRLFQLPFFLGSFFLSALKSKGEVLHAYWTPASLVALAVKLFTGKPVVLHLWGSDILFTQIPIIWHLLVKLFNRADAIICESQHFADQIIAKGVSRKLVTVLPNGIDLEQFKPLDKISLRTQWGLPLDRPLLLTIGSLSEIKGHKYLLTALPNILEAYGPVQVVIVGEGEFRLFTELMIAKLKLNNCVHLAGFQKGETIAQWLNTADIFVLPSLLEGTPNILLEAMACELPVVSTSVGGIGSVIEDGENGLLISPKSGTELADAVISLLRDPVLRKRLGTNARKTLLGQYGSWVEQSIKLKKLYGEIIRSAEI